MTSTDWAAWVQAIGTIIGIGIAIAVPWWQTRVARQDQQEEYLKRASALIVLFYPEIDRLRESITEARKWLDFGTPSDPTFFRQRLEELSLPKCDNLKNHIHDAVYFDKDTASLYHHLISETKAYERMTSYMLRNEYINPTSYAILRRHLDEIEVIADNLLGRFNRNYVANTQYSGDLLTSRESSMSQ